MLRVFQQTLRDTRLNALPQSALKAGAWVVAHSPTQEELQWLSSVCGLDRGLLKDALDPFEVPRYEVEDNTVYFFFRYPIERDGELTTASALLAITPEIVVTVAEHRIASFEAIIKEGVSKVPTTQRTKFFLFLLRRIVGAYTTAVNRIQRQVYAYRTHPHHLTERAIDAFVHHENTLNDFLSALIPMNAGLSQLLREGRLPLYEEDVEFIEDLQLAVGQLLERCRSVLKTAQNIRDAFSAIATTRLNRIVKRLTALTVILAVLTVVTSLWGMNVPVPFAEHPWGFWIVSGGALALAGAIGVWFLKNGWL